MRGLTRFALLSSSVAVFASGLLLAGGYFSKPRDYASPPTNIKIISESGVPLSNVEVSREWWDSDTDEKGSGTTKTDPTGTARFPKIPANVGLLTGAWRKTQANVEPRGAGSGTCTTIKIPLIGVSDVKPEVGSLHIFNEGGAYADKDGVTFYTYFDKSRSNSVTAITFPEKSKSIDYVLSAKSNAN